MDKEQLVDKTVEVLRPFETQNLMTTIQNLTLHQILTNWIFLLVTMGILFFGVYKKSKTILLTLFFLVAMIFMVKLVMPPPDQELTLNGILPFAGFGLGVGGVIVYFLFIKD